MNAEERAETQAQLTQFASQRVTWIEAMEITRRRAADAFLARQDEFAQKLRDLAKEFEQKANAASETQTKLLRKLGQ